jgi:hypothetical protein
MELQFMAAIFFTVAWDLTKKGQPISNHLSFFAKEAMKSELVKALPITGLQLACSGENKLAEEFDLN